MPEIVLSLCFTFVSDVLALFALLISFVPVVGQIALVSSKIFSFAIFLIIQGWLFIKGAKSPNQSISKWLTKLIFSGGSTLDISGIPFAQTTSLAAVIWMGNHPKAAALATTAALAVATGGAGAAAGAAGAAGAAEAGGAAAAQGTIGAQATRATLAGGRTMGAVGADVGETGASMETAGVKTGTQLPGKGSDLEEALGARKESIREIIDIMQRMPEPEAASDDEESDQEVA